MDRERCESPSHFEWNFIHIQRLRRPKERIVSCQLWIVSGKLGSLSEAEMNTIFQIDKFTQRLLPESSIANTPGHWAESKWTVGKREPWAVRCKLPGGHRPPINADSIDTVLVYWFEDLNLQIANCEMWVNWAISRQLSDDNRESWVWKCPAVKNGRN